MRYLLNLSVCSRCRPSTSTATATTSRLLSFPSTLIHQPVTPMEIGSMPSGWKGKGREMQHVVRRSYSSCRNSRIREEGENNRIRRRISNGSSTAAAASATTPSSSSSTILQPADVHEDLLSTSPSPRSSTNPTRSKINYFSRSFLAAPVLPPPSTSPLVPLSASIPSPLPPTLLSNGLPNPLIRWRERPLTTVGDDLELYKTLAKSRLTALVVLTAMSGYAMCPVDPTSAHAAMELFANSLGTTTLDSLTPSSSTNSLALSVLLPATVGTALCSSSAATFNQLIEAPYDAQMTRTRARPMPRRIMSPLHATSFGLLTGVTGVGTLYAINPLAASIGLGTILLYFPIYTLLKRHTIYNTWLGAVVGALPPLIGWSACTGTLSPLTEPGAWALFALMFFWQFPHFNALSHTLRSSYAGSGYRMLAVLDPRQNALVALRYSFALVPLSFLFPPLGLTTVWFPLFATIPNGAMGIAAWRFWRKREDRRAKVLFWTSLVHLPAVFGLAMVCKKSLWESDADALVDDEEEGSGEAEEEEAQERQEAKVVV